MYNAVKSMDDKAVCKNLSWQDGFVSSVNGVTIACTEDNKIQVQERKAKQQRGQKEKAEGKAKSKEEDSHQQLGQSKMDNRQKSPSRQPTASILKQTTSSSISEIEGSSAISHKYQSMSPKTYGIETQRSSSNNKENTSATSTSGMRSKHPSSSFTSTTGFACNGDNASSANRMSLFEEEYQRKIQLLRSSAKKKEDKLFVLLNRNAGVITHVIRTNPKYLNK